MSKLPPPLTEAQRHLLMDIHLFRGIIHFRESRIHPPLWGYYLVKYYKEKDPYSVPRNRRTVESLIHKGALIPELSDKEFAVQLALGTVNCRVYRLPRRICQQV
ncbi:hypothetical protein LCGC14_2038830 [marine sediment metagenome]|uniref:Uncharacterized protein n=1 Tax=marine sediment metagenome TaxID=412755 RepID=A0A0F9FF38_9ZZZZ